MTDDEVVEGTATLEHEEVARMAPPTPATPGGQLVVRHHASQLATHDEMTFEELVKRRELVKRAMDEVMVPGLHYGEVPGTRGKPSLFKPGAEVLCNLFKLAPTYVQHIERSDDGHMDVTTTCNLTHIPTGLFVASGEAMCTTRESKYAYRYANRTCPDCGSDAVRESRDEDRPGWYCWRKVGGCGHQFGAGTEQANAIAAQTVGRVDNEDLPDEWNTVIKMAAKRAKVAAVLDATAASDVFTQDLEDRQGSGADAPATTQARQDAAAGGQPAQAGRGTGGGQQQAAQDAPAPQGVPPAAPADYQPRYQSVTDVLAALEEYDKVYPWAALMATATRQLFPDAKAERFGDLPGYVKKQAWLRMNRVMDWLEDNLGGRGTLNPPTREDVQRAFAACWEGLAVPVPDNVGYSDADREKARAALAAAEDAQRANEQPSPEAAQEVARMTGADVPAGASSDEVAAAAAEALQAQGAADSGAEEDIPFGPGPSE